MPVAFVAHTSRVPVKVRASKGFQKDGASEPSKGTSKGSSKDANQQFKVSCLVINHCILLDLNQPCRAEERLI